MSSLDVHQVMLDAIEQVRPLLQARRHQLTLEYRHGRRLPGSSEDLLAQTIANLLTNAVRYRAKADAPRGGCPR